MATITAWSVGVHTLYMLTAFSLRGHGLTRIPASTRHHTGEGLGVSIAPD